MKQKLKLMTAFMCGAVFFSGVSYAATELKARITDYKIVVNGEEKKLSNNVVSINGSSYLPVRALGESIGYEVGFNNGVITLDNESAEKDSEAVKTDGKGTNKLAAKYSKDGKLNATLLKNALTNKEVTINQLDEETGESFFHVVIKEDNFEAYKVLKANKIDPQLKDKNGNTPLHLVVMNDNSFYFGELINEFGVKLQYKNNEGKYPFDYATKNSSYHSWLMFTDKAE